MRLRVLKDCDVFVGRGGYWGDGDLYRAVSGGGPCHAGREIVASAVDQCDYVGELVEAARGFRVTRHGVGCLLLREFVESCLNVILKYNQNLDMFSPHLL